jgi:septation ring formation regulator
MDGLVLEITTYFIMAALLIIVILNIMSFIHKSRLKKDIEALELNKNKVISAPIMSELSKVEALVKNEKIEERFKNWRSRFDTIKNVSLSSINDMLLEADFLLEQKKYKELMNLIAKIELDLYKANLKTNYLLNEIKEITLSEEKNRNIMTNLKASYRDLLQKFISTKEDFGFVTNSIELQFENIEKRFSEFEKAMENNDYDEVNHIVKALDDMINHMEIVINEVPAIVLSIDNLIPQRIKEIKDLSEQMTKDGYQLDYLNVEYNIEEIEKKVNDILDRVKVLNLEDVSFEIKTFIEYFDNLFNDFEREKMVRKVYEEEVIIFHAKITKLNDIITELYNQLDETKYNYDISEHNLEELDTINQELNAINTDFKALKETTRTKSFPYSKLNMELEQLGNRLNKLESNLDSLMQTVGNMKDDEKRAREQLNDIEELLRKAKYRIRDYKIPIIPNNYFVELKEASAAVREIVKELDKKPINIEVLNTRVDTARDLAFKLFNTTNEMIKTVQLAEMAIIYGNRYRSSKPIVEEGLNKAEICFIKGDYKRSLELTINTIEIIEPGIYRRLINLYEEQ